MDWYIADKVPTFSLYRSIKQHLFYKNLLYYNIVNYSKVKIIGRFRDTPLHR